MRIAVASGKGGTGKTMIAVSLALSLSGISGVSLLDCDVEGPNDHLFIHPVFTGSEPVSIPVPEIDEERCDHCGTCAKVCAFNALAVLPDRVLTFSQLCHGCGACKLLCPSQAIVEREREVGMIEWGRGEGIDLVRGTLSVGEVLAPEVIRMVKKRLDNSVSNQTAILDAPPGTSCPMVETLKKSDYCLLVTEPTPFGLHDLRLAVEVANVLDISCGVVLNKVGIGKERIDEFCRESGIPLLMSLPFDGRIARCTAHGIPLIREIPAWESKFRECASRIQEIIG